MHSQEIALVEKLAECGNELQMANKGKITGLEKPLVCKTGKIMLATDNGKKSKILKEAFLVSFFNAGKFYFLSQFRELTGLSGAVLT